jgi:hypothetical protein
MRWLLLLAVLLPQSDTLTGQWVGPLSMSFEIPRKGRGEIPTFVDLTQTGDSITGTWRSAPPNTSSGTISGTIDKLQVVFYADATTEAERCQARVTFKAQITAARIYKLTADRMQPDLRISKACGPWPTDLVWLLQRTH